jgi:aldehyde:ferredoxin oxidoreductase
VLPITAQEPLLRDAGELFDFGRCRVCDGHFRKEVHEGHLNHYRELFEQYAPERRRLAAHRLSQEEALGARMTCEVPGMPAVTEEALRRHVERFGWEGVKEVATTTGIDLNQTRPRRHAKRIVTVQRLYKEHLSLEEIAFRTDLTLQTVKKYLAAPSEPMEESGPKVHSPASKAADWPRQWDTPRKRALGERIIALRRSRLRPMAVASRLGKSDVVVRRYLREAEAAGLVC